MNILQNGRMYASCFMILLIIGCSTAGKHRENIDKTAYTIIEEKQMKAFGKTEPFSVEPPEDTLRRRLMIEQNIPYSSPASLGAKNLEPIEHWPKDNYLDAKDIKNATSYNPENPLKLTLVDILQIAAQNNRQYQSSKESVFREALSLDLQRDNFRHTFAGSIDSGLSADLGGDETTSGSENTGLVNYSRKFLNGITLTSRIGLDMVKMLNPFSASSYSLFGDASISVPLLRGAGRHIVAEPLIQAERNTLYAIYDFERYKRSFAVSMTNTYLSTLQVIDQIDNAEANYRRSITSTRLIRRLSDAGKQDPVDVDQSIQQEYSSRNSWIGSQFRYQSSLDSLKIQLGLPPDVEIELDRNELDRLTQSAKSLIREVSVEADGEEVPPADAPVTLQPFTMENAGPMELEESQAIQLALDNRLDLRVAQGNIYDAQRNVVVAADALRAEFNLLGSATVGEGRSLGSASRSDNLDLDFEKGRYNALVSLDLPIERTREIVTYRQSILSLERAVRDLQDLEDSIKLNIRGLLRDLQEARESLQIEAQSVVLNQRRVSMTDLKLQAGRAVIRDVLDAQRDLLSSQNSLTSAMVNYRMAELELQRDLDILIIDENGIWNEFSAQELKK